MGGRMVLPPPDLSSPSAVVPSSPGGEGEGGTDGGLLSVAQRVASLLSALRRTVTRDLPIAICRPIILSFLRSSINS